MIGERNRWITVGLPLAVGVAFVPPACDWLIAHGVFESRNVGESVIGLLFMLPGSFLVARWVSRRDREKAGQGVGSPSFGVSWLQLEALTIIWVFGGFLIWFYLLKGYETMIGRHLFEGISFDPAVGRENTFADIFAPLLQRPGDVLVLTLSVAAFIVGEKYFRRFVIAGAQRVLKRWQGGDLEG